MKPICKEYYRLSRLPDIQWTIDYTFQRINFRRLSAETPYTPVCVLERLMLDEEDWLTRANAIHRMVRLEMKENV